MFFRLIADNFARRPRRKLLTAAALSLGMAVATAALSVSLDVGDRLSQEFRSLGANLVVTPESDSLPLEIGGVDYRPVNAGAYLPESDLAKIKTVFWHNNIIAIAPILEVRAQAWSERSIRPAVDHVNVIGTWANHPVRLADGAVFQTGVRETSPWWHTEGNWFKEDASECVMGVNFAEKNGLRVGDTVNFSAHGRNWRTGRASTGSFMFPP
jgi:putative ABC transport system permease protein